jgi:hypothetical protein
MSLRRVVNGFLVVFAFAWLSLAAMASEYHGQVTFSGLPLPGSTVTVTATQGDKKVVAISDEQGLFSFTDLADGKWSLNIEMTGFAPLKQEITVAPNAEAGTFEMKVMTIDQIRAEDKPVKFDPAQLANPPVVAAESAPSAAAAAKGAATPGKGVAGAKTQTAAGAVPEAPPPPDATAQQANDGMLINGSVNNAATSQFSMNAAFGNNRNGGRSLYNGNAFLTLDNSTLDAAPFNLTGQAQPRPQFNNFTAGINYGGPLNIKGLMPRGPNLQFNYSRNQNSEFNTQAILIPTGRDASGNWNLTSPTVTSINVPSNLATVAPQCNSYLLSTGMTQAQINSGMAQFANNTIPVQCVTSASNVLLSLYPQGTNITGDPQYNYELPLNTSSHSDNYGLSAQRQLGTKNNLNGRFNFQDSTSNQPSIFGFLDTSSSVGLNSNLTFSRRFTQRLYGSASYTFSRSRSQLIPNFANKTNIEGAAGITGASASSAYWGPPSLSFSSGIAGLSDGVSFYNRRETNSISVSMNWNHTRHNVNFGGGFNRLEFNYLTELNPDGSLSFTGAATRSSAGAGGSDVADFLLGIPDTSRIAFGNADKYLRQTTSNLFLLDDFRMSPEFTVNAGVRWEYGSPVSEIKGRLVNLDVAPGFSTATPVVGSNPLLQHDYSRPEPHISIAWRPISGSSLLIRSGYDVNNDTSVYQSASSAMAQQMGPPSNPLSTSLQISNSIACPFNIFSPFAQQSCSTTSPDAFAIDPHFRVGYVQTWNLAVQRDLPFSLQTIVTYLGIKGTRGVQEFLPNSCPPPASGVSTACTTATSGYVYRTSNGNLTREAGTLELRRRLRNGFQARMLYTYAKSLDDDYSLSGQGSVNNSSGIAQDWTNPAGQRGLSTTDQRHLLNLTAQYTTGMGLGGKMLLTGWRGAIYKEWTVQTTFAIGSGLPETPIYLGATESGTGVSGTIRPNVTGSPYTGAKPGYVLNVNNYSAPLGSYGNARRDSIEGPDQFSLNAGMNRTFRLHDKYTLDAQLNATNILNHVVYSGWNSSWIPGSQTFGAPAGANPMRSISVTFRARF